MRGYKVGVMKVLALLKNIIPTRWSWRLFKLTGRYQINTFLWIEIWFSKKRKKGVEFGCFEL
jgi:hypothetical protein